jgi:hypothetical protein
VGGKKNNAFCSPAYFYLDRVVQVARARKVDKAEATRPVGGPVQHDGGVGGVEGREFWEREGGRDGRTVSGEQRARGARSSSFLSYALSLRSASFRCQEMPPTKALCMLDRAAVVVVVAVAGAGRLGAAAVTGGGAALAAALATTRDRSAGAASSTTLCGGTVGGSGAGGGAAAAAVGTAWSSESAMKCSRLDEYRKNDQH